MTAPRSIIEGGKLLCRYAGPFKSREIAERKLDYYFADGQISEWELPVISRNAIYVRAY